LREASPKRNFCEKSNIAASVEWSDRVWCKKNSIIYVFICWCSGYYFNTQVLDASSRVIKKEQNISPLSLAMLHAATDSPAAAGGRSPQNITAPRDRTIAMMSFRAIALLVCRQRCSRGEAAASATIAH